VPQVGSIWQRINKHMHGTGGLLRTGMRCWRRRSAAQTSGSKLLNIMRRRLLAM